MLHCLRNGHVPRRLEQMKTDVRFRGLSKHKRLDSYTRWRLSNALDRHADCIGKLIVTVESDGQVQLKCRIIAQVMPDQYIVVAARSTHVLEAIDDAVDKATRSIERIIDKQQERSRETWPPSDWVEPTMAWSDHLPAE